MLSVPVFNMDGQRTGEVPIDPALLGGEVRTQLLKQAVVAYQDHKRQHSARTKGRSQVVGSTRKLYRQKGTGNARVGNSRTPIRRGGGCAFAKRVPAAVKTLPKKMRRLARNSAILAKIQSEDALIVEDMRWEQPKTSVFASMLSALNVRAGCVVALGEADRNIYLSGRNVPGTAIRLVKELNAYEVLKGRKLIFTKPAFDLLLANPATFTPAASQD